MIIYSVKGANWRPCCEINEGPIHYKLVAAVGSKSGLSNRNLSGEQSAMPPKKEQATGQAEGVASSSSGAGCIKVGRTLGLYVGRSLYVGRN